VIQCTYRSPTGADHLKLKYDPFGHTEAEDPARQGIGMSRGIQMHGYSRRARESGPSHTPVMPLAILVVTVAQLLDLGTFATMIGVHGLVSEANPLVAGLLASHGLEFAAVAKVAALSLVVAIIVVLAERTDRPGYPRLARTIAAIAVVAGLIGGLTNALVLV
jgi:hypothetical protein